MREKIVADSACLIALDRIGHIQVIFDLFEPVLIPPAVQQEFGKSLAWLTVRQPSDPALVTTLKMLVDDGEAEAIALAQEQKCRIILDDRKARSAAKNMNLSIIGTVGVLIRAKKVGLRPAVRPLLDALEQNSFYISSDLKEEALRIAEE